MESTWPQRLLLVFHRRHPLQFCREPELNPLSSVGSVSHTGEDTSQRLYGPLSPRLASPGRRPHSLHAGARGLCLSARMSVCLATRQRKAWLGPLGCRSGPGVSFDFATPFPRRSLTQPPKPCIGEALSSTHSALKGRVPHIFVWCHSSLRGAGWLVCAV